MAEIQSNTKQRHSEKLISSSSSNRVLDLVKDFEMMESPPLRKEYTPRNGRNNDYSHCNEDEDSVLCVWGSKLVPTGINCTENISKFVSCGSESVEELENSVPEIMPDDAFEGGHVLITDENIVNAGHYASLYQSARVGDFSYRFDNLSARDYLVDFHFAEIINTNGPKGMRVFDVFMQEEKVISNLDIYSIVGANKPLQLIDIRVTVEDNGVLLIRFEGVHGSPIISGICIKEAMNLAASQVKQECLLCDKCAAKTEFSSAQSKNPRVTSIAKYEKKIDELSTQYRLKTEECYQAWMSLTAMNKQLEEVSMELDNKSFQNHCLDLQAAKLRDVSSKHEHDKNFWVAAIDELGTKIKIMKEEHSKLSHDAQECANSIPNMLEMVSAVKGLVAQCDALKVKYSEEQANRKVIYNQLQEAKGNIRVFCRCRPLNKEEVSAGCSTVVDFDTANDGDLGILTGGSTKKLYKFDRVYTPKDDQVDVYMDASSMVISVLDGYNVCIFAYGQTGTGKTFTMEGTEESRGVNYRTLEQLFRMVEERKETHSYNISLNVLEVYNEQIRDLLATSPSLKKLEVRQASEGVHHVPGLVEAKVENIKEVWSALQAGSSARAIGSNNVNEHSSRSHCMICIMVRAKNKINGECTTSKLWLVDLAGSERLAKTEAQGERLKEAQNINRSLSALGDVISALAAKSSHIPYRNSKLTHLLQDSLGGDSKTLMFVQISPSEKDLGETVSSLNFATRVRGIELGPARRQLDTGELQKLKLLVEKTKQESKSKDEALRKLEESFQCLQGKAKSKDQLCKNQNEKFSELEIQLESKTDLCKQLEKQLFQLSNEVKGKEEVCSTLQRKVIELEKKWKEQEHVESKTLQHKVNKLENKLKERREEFELQLVTYQEKIKELENKLQTQRDNTGSLLHQKIKELEEKLKQEDHPQAQSACLPTSSCSSEKLRVTPNERKAWSTTVQTPPVLSDSQRPRSLRCTNRLEGGQQGSSILLKGTDSLRELRRNRADVQSKGIENNLLLSGGGGGGGSLAEKKVVVVPPGSSKVARQIDPSKAFARVTRTTKPSFSGAQRSISRNTTNREQAPGVRVRDHNTRLWSR